MYTEYLSCVCVCVCVFFSFFLHVFYFSLYRCFTFLVKFISGYFILFDSVVNEIVSFISLSYDLLLVYRNVTDFCILILYPLTNKYLFIYSTCFYFTSICLLNMQIKFEFYYKCNLQFCCQFCIPILVLHVFKWNLQGFVYIVSCHLPNSDSFTSSFLLWMTFISFSCIIAMARALAT